MVIYLSLYAAGFIALAIILSYKYNVVVAIISTILWSLLALFLASFMVMVSSPKTEVLTTLPKNVGVPTHFVVDAKEKVLYEEHENGELEFFAGEGRVKSIDFIESTKVKEPVVKIKAKRVYQMDNINPFKYVPTIEAEVDRVVIPVDYSEKAPAKGEASK